MNKKVILSIALLSSLAGCNKDKKKPKQVTQKSDLFSAVDMPMAKNVDIDISEDSEVLSFFDEDLGEFAFADEEDTEYTQTASYETKPAIDERNITAWIDNAQEDTELKTIYFGFNKYGVTPDQKETIEADTTILADLLEIIDDNAFVVIEGHSCHSAGSASYNMGLSEKRAKYVRDILVQSGIDADRILIIGRGQEVPALIEGKPVTGNREQQAMNRRVEIRIVEQA